MSTKQLSSYQIAATYIGTIVGAGFASGQEVLQFFGVYGIRGLGAVVLTTGMFAIFGYLALSISKEIKAKSHLQLIRYTSGNTLGYLIDLVITGFLFGAVVTMAAGMGAIFQQEFGLANNLGIGLLLALTLITVFFGISGVITAISYLVPVLMVAVLGVSLASVSLNYEMFLTNLAWSEPQLAPIPYWPLSAVIYTSYNIVIAVAVLAPIGVLASHENLKKGAILGAAGLGLGAFAITMALIANVPAVLQVEVPMLVIGGTISPIIGQLYALALIAGVYTTAVASLYGFGARIADPATSTFKWLVAGSSAMAFFLAQLGFSTLVGVLFTAVGYAGLLLLGSFTYVLINRHGVLQSLPMFRWRFPGVGYRKLLIGQEQVAGERYRLEGGWNQLKTKKKRKFNER